MRILKFYFLRKFQLYNTMQEIVKRDCQSRKLIERINLNHAKLLLFGWFCFMKVAILYNQLIGGRRQAGWDLRLATRFLVF